MGFTSDALRARSVKKKKKEDAHRGRQHHKEMACEAYYTRPKCPQGPNIADIKRPTTPPFRVGEVNLETTAAHENQVHPLHLWVSHRPLSRAQQRSGAVC